MNKPIVVLGSGPTAIFAYQCLRAAGCNVRLLGDFSSASIVPVATPHGKVTLVPVFPPLPRPGFPPSTSTIEALTVMRAGSSRWVDKLDARKFSLVDALLPDRDAAAMSIKQYGY